MCKTGTGRWEVITVDTCKTIDIPASPDLPDKSIGQMIMRKFINRVISRNNSHCMKASERVFIRECDALPHTDPATIVKDRGI